MYKWAFRAGVHSLATIVLAVGLVATAPSRAWSYTPDDPIVQQMVTKAIRYLENLNWDNFQNSIEGDNILVGYAHFKVEHDPEHPLVKKAIASSMKILEDARSGKYGHKMNYEISVAAFLLAGIDSKRYEPELREIQKFLFDEQMSHGGWGYHGDQKGDVSR